MAKPQTIQKIKICAPLVCIILSLSILLFATLILPSILKSTINEQLKMSSDTWEYWGQFPGKTRSVTIRNFTFYNFTNPRQFLYQDKTPVFNQIGGFLLQQRFNFTDYQYNQDMSQINYNYWLFFTEVQGTKDIDDQVNVINVAPLGFWYQLDKVGLPTFALQGFGGLFVQLSQTFKIQAIGQGVSSQFLSQSNWQSICINNEISPQLCNLTWNDPQHGLSDPNNFQIWIQFSYLNDQSSQSYLQTYFGFTDIQMYSLKQLFKGYAITLNNILNNWFCDGNECTSYDMTLLQLSSGKITADPPSGDKVDSICQTGNITCIGEPQISTFLKGEFKKKYDDQTYQKLTFSIQTFTTLFTPYNGTLLNIGKLTELFQFGFGYDNAKSQDERDYCMTGLIIITNAESDKHAFVIWQWVKYFTQQFVIKRSKGGSQKNSGIGGVFSQAFYQSFTGFGQWIVEEYIEVLGQEIIGDCKEFVKKTIQNIQDFKVQRICSKIDKNKGGYLNVLQPCIYPPTKKQQYRQTNFLNLNEFAQYCDKEQTSFYTVLMNIHEKIFNQYNCRTSKGLKICSAYELSIKQFINSSITLNPIQNSVKKYEKTLTGKKWNTNLGEFEYKQFLKEVVNDEHIDQQTFADQQLIDLMSFDKLFSASMIMELMLQNDNDRFQKNFYWKNMTLLKNYIKFVTVQVGFGGFTQKRSPRELLFGYEDPFLKNLKQMDTMIGGDPSINPMVLLNQPNSTLQQAKLYPQSVYSGYSDISKVREYTSLFHKKYITYNKTWYDGYEVKYEFVNPYIKQDYVRGTDAMQNPSNLNEQSQVYCYLINIYRYAKLDYSDKSEILDFNVLNFRVDSNFLKSSSQYQPNSIYYQTFQGFQNLSFLGVPLFVSKNHFYDCPQNWTKLVKIYDPQHNSTEISSTIQDDTVLTIEPYSGALFYATVRLQTNYHFQSDNLFSPSERMLPITYVCRQGSIDPLTVDQLLGDLRFALKMKLALIIISIIFIVGSVGLFVYFMYKKKKQIKQIKQIKEENQLKRDLLASVVSEEEISKNTSVNINKTIVQTTKQ